MTHTNHIYLYSVFVAGRFFGSSHAQRGRDVLLDLAGKKYPNDAASLTITEVK